MQITEELLTSLSEQAKASPRLRVAYDLRTTPADNSQRMLCAMESGTIFFEAKDGAYAPLAEDEIF